MVISTGTLLLLFFIVLLVAGLPAWPYSRSWGYAPTGFFSTLLLIVVVLLLMGRI